MPNSAPAPTYDTGVKVTDAQIDALTLSRHCLRGDWNYTLRPAGAHPHPDKNGSKTTGHTVTPAARAPRRLGSASLRNPELTGMTTTQLNPLVGELVPALEEHRKLGTHDLLAVLFGVTRSTLSRAAQEVRPFWPTAVTRSCLQQHCSAQLRT